MQKYHFVILLTNKCNLQCKHCAVHKEEPIELSLKQIKQIIEYKPTKVNLMGGEPLMYTHFDEVVELLNDAGILITVQTNGTLVKEKIKTLEKVREVILSIEGLKETTNMIRGKGVFQKVIKSHKILKERNIPVLFRSSLWKGILKDIPKICKFAKMMDTPLYFYPILGSPPLDFSEQVWLFKVLNEYDNVWLDLPNYFSCTGGRKSYCSACVSRLAFQPDGRITPCQWFDYYLGHIGDPMEEILENCKIFARTVKKIPNECLGCKYQDTCSGGCLLTPYFVGCPCRPSFQHLIDTKSYWNFPKTEKIAVLLKGVVTC